MIDHLSRKDRERYRSIVRQLSDLSRGGWAQAYPVDYQPLEAELREIERDRERLNNVRLLTRRV